MGYYVNSNSNGVVLPEKNKADYLILDGGVEVFPKFFQPNLICIVENPMFEAAGYCYNAQEFDAFTDPNDHRKKRWVIHPKAAELSGYTR